MPYRFENLKLISGFIRSPRSVGSIIPSSQSLSRRLAAFPSKRADTIIELGAGTGPITREITQKTNHLICYEKCTVMSSTLQERHPNAVIKSEDAMGCVRDIHNSHDIGRKCHIISSLPLTTMPRDYVRKLLFEISESLLPEEYFCCFLYWPNILLKRNKWIPKLLSSNFNHINYSLEVKNLPPALIIMCSK